DLCGYLKDSKSEMSTLARRKKIKIHLQVPEKTEVLIDRAHLNKIFQNLFSNAIKFNRNGGSINVKSKLQKKRVLVSVADTGIGIPRRAIPYVFKRFYRGINKVKLPG